MQFQKVGITIYFMRNSKGRLIVGITTFNVELLRVSVPVLARLRQKIFLIIYNDNPSTRLTRRDIRRMGYRGDLHIINGNGGGKLRAQMEIADAAQKVSPNSQWIVFVEDDAILTDATVPDVSDDVFAVIQNSITVRKNLVDLFRAMDAPGNISPDGDGLILTRPNIGLAGTIVRIQIVAGVYKVMNSLFNDDNNDILDAGDISNAVMWSLINTYARHENPAATPIYMDCVNYIKTDFNPRSIRTGTRNRAIAKFDAILTDALAAAPLGQ